MCYTRNQTKNKKKCPPRNLHTVAVYVALRNFSGCQLASLASHQAKVTRPMVPMPTGVLVVPMLGSVSITKSCSAKQSAEVGQTSSHENQNPKLKGHQVGAREGVMYAEVGKTS